jgi:hypothetical protein
LLHVGAEQFVANKISSRTINDFQCSVVVAVQQSFNTYKLIKEFERCDPVTLLTNVTKFFLPRTSQYSHNLRNRRSGLLEQQVQLLVEALTTKRKPNPREKKRRKKSKKNKNIYQSQNQIQIKTNTEAKPKTKTKPTNHIKKKIEKIEK